MRINFLTLDALVFLLCPLGCLETLTCFTFFLCRLAILNHYTTGLGVRVPVPALIRSSSIGARLFDKGYLLRATDTLDQRRRKR